MPMLDSPLTTVPSCGRGAASVLASDLPGLPMGARPTGKVAIGNPAVLPAFPRVRVRPTIEMDHDLGGLHDKHREAHECA
jgi:hypothetical protein